MLDSNKAAVESAARTIAGLSERLWELERNDSSSQYRYYMEIATKAIIAAEMAYYGSVGSGSTSND